jgi:nicotinamide N-methyltransferase
MKETMEKMELERAEMVAEVEAQIEMALASMAVDVDDSDEGGTGSHTGSRPHSRLSSTSGQQRSRRTSDAGKRVLRSFGTESTLAESYVDGKDDALVGRSERGTGTIVEDDEESAPSPKKKRFSATEVDMPQDGMNAVDEGISQKTDRIAQKVFEIQQKVSSLCRFASDVEQTLEILQLETALATDKRTAQWKKQIANQDSETELSETTAVRTRPVRGTKLVNKLPKKRRGSSTTSSAQSRASTPAVQSTDEGTASPTVRPRTLFTPVQTPSEAPTHVRSASETSRDEPPMRRISSGASLSATRPVSPSELTPTTPSLTPGAFATTDDEETDFQSAYSASPRESYGSFEIGKEQVYKNVDDNSPILPEDGNKGDFGRHISSHTNGKRERVSSNATTIHHHDHAQPSPTFSDDTVISPPAMLSNRILVEE